MTRSAAPVRLTFEAIGTSWFIELDEPITKTIQQRMMRLIHERIELFDQAYSRFRDDSLVNEMARTGGRFKLPDDAAPLMELYQALYKITGGKVTPLVADTLSDAGYDATYSLRPRPTLRSTPPWEEVLAYDPPYLSLKRPVSLDFGAAGKGYLVDLVAELIEAAGISNYTIDAGGDMRHRNMTGRQLRVALEHPLDAKQAIGVFELDNRSLCASAGSRRAWGPYHHIFDPHRAESVRSAAATWVVADSTLLADGLATALFFVDPIALAHQYEFEYAIVRENLSYECSPAFAAVMFEPRYHHERHR